MAEKVKWLLIGAGVIAGKRVADALANSAGSGCPYARGGEPTFIVALVWAVMMSPRTWG
jgi:hypothetical protein